MEFGSAVSAGIQSFTDPPNQVECRHSTVRGCSFPTDLTNLTDSLIIPLQELHHLLQRHHLHGDDAVGDIEAMTTPMILTTMAAMSLVRRRHERLTLLLIPQIMENLLDHASHEALLVTMIVIKATDIKAIVRQQDPTEVREVEKAVVEGRVNSLPICLPMEEMWPKNLSRRFSAFLINEHPMLLHLLAIQAAIPRRAGIL